MKRQAARLIVSGDRHYHLFESGEIGHSANGPTSGQWRVIGAVTRNNLGGATRRWTLAEILADPSGIPWRCKNGKQHTFLQDYDHGTGREWRSPNHHVS